MNGNKPRLLIASPWGSTDTPATLSGIPFYLKPHLSDHFEILTADNISSPIEMGMATRLSIKLDKKFSAWRSINFPGARKVIAESFSRWLTSQTQKLQPDAVLTFGCSPVAYYGGKAPVILYIDALYAYKLLVYEWLQNGKLSNREKIDIENADVLGLSNSSKVIFTSKIIADKSAEIYPQYKEKMGVAGIGANIDDPIDRDFSRRPIDDGLNLIFVSTKFLRKGGDFVLKILSRLNGSREKVRLHIIGDFIPHDKIKYPDNVTIHGWIEKSNAKEMARFRSLLNSSHLHILPTRGDLSPHTICEMNAYGVPTVARNVGGIANLVKEGVTGRVLDGWEIDGWVEAIGDIISNHEWYSRNARRLYEEEQTWEIVAKRIADNIWKLSAGTTSSSYRPPS